MDLFENWIVVYIDGAYLVSKFDGRFILSCLMGLCHFVILPFTFSSSQKLLNQMEPTFTGSICGGSFTKFLRLALIGQKTWLPWKIGWHVKNLHIWYYLAKWNSNFDVKHLPWYERSIVMFPHSIPIRQKRWWPWRISFPIGWYIKLSFESSPEDVYRLSPSRRVCRG